ncbi:hypothetical protein GW813_04125 [bacterium]|nr:hypothetical protein [bacterium]
MKNDMKNGMMMDYEGRLGGSGKIRKAAGTAQSRVDANRDVDAMSRHMESCCAKHPLKSGKTRPA